MDGPSYMQQLTIYWQFIKYTCDANDVSTLYIAVDLHVRYDVVTDWSYALAGILVSTLFGVSPGQSCFSIRIFFQYYCTFNNSGTSRSSIEVQDEKTEKTCRTDILLC